MYENMLRCQLSWRMNKTIIWAIIGLGCGNCSQNIDRILNKTAKWRKRRCKYCHYKQTSMDLLLLRNIGQNLNKHDTWIESQSQTIYSLLQNTFLQISATPWTLSWIVERTYQRPPPLIEKECCVFSAT